jgi:hypothetical protein
MTLKKLIQDCTTLYETLIISNFYSHFVYLIAKITTTLLPPLCLNFHTDFVQKILKRHSLQTDLPNRNLMEKH